MSTADKFLKTANTKAFDIPHRNTIKFNMSKYYAAVETGKQMYANRELARARASYIKTQAVENLDKYLIEFETNFIKNGGKVIWARDSKEALEEIWKIVEKKKTRSVVKSKTMTTEEIELNEFLEHKGIETVETDLGEYIVQLAGQKPYHIVTPAMHLSRFDIAKIFTQHLHTDYTDDPQELTLIARRLLRDKYLQAEIGISGGNFLVADVGGIAVTENEGNARMCTTFPKTHIAIVGIEKMVPSMADLDLFWPLLSTSGTGQNITVYNSIMMGPRKADEADGPDEMYVVLLDNGRTDLLADPDKRQALNCIRCGACLNACPVYKNIGGHTYDTPYSGPIGSVITPHLRGMEEFKHLSFASSLCGACTAVCPVKIDLHNLLLLNRKESYDKKIVAQSDKIAFQLWKKGMMSRSTMNFMGATMKNLSLNTFFKSAWGKRRSMPKVAPKSFNELWKARRK
jgi:L-lactate dehydrogenase complex protein LldF